MPFVLVDKEKAQQEGIRHNFIDHEAGIYADDEVHVIVRPLTELETRRFQDQFSDLNQSEKSKRASTLNREREEVLHQRIKASVIGWGGIRDTEGMSVSYSWENLKNAFEQNPAFLSFVLQAVADPYSETRKLQDAEKN